MASVLPQCSATEAAQAAVARAVERMAIRPRDKSTQEKLTAAAVETPELLPVIDALQGAPALFSRITPQLPRRTATR